MAKKQGLGKGLSALLADAESFDQMKNGERVEMIERSRIRPNPDQPRKVFDADKLAELAESIRNHGIMQPLILTSTQDGYLIAAGERRFRAAELAGLVEVPCLIRELDAKQLAEISLLENIQREDLSPLEEAEGYQALISQHGYTQEQLAERLGKSRPHVANTLRLLRLAVQDKKLLQEGKISAGHARAMLSLTDARQRQKLTEAILREQLNVRQAEELAARLRSRGQTAPKTRSPQQLIHDDIARQFSARLGLRATIVGRGSRGKVVLEFTSEDDLQNICDAILE